MLGSVDDLDALNINLIAPQAKWLIPKRLLHVELPMCKVQFDKRNGKETKLVSAQSEWLRSAADQESGK